MLWRFQVVDLKEYVRFEDEEDNNLAEKFVKTVLDTEVFLEEKDCEDILEIDREKGGSCSIYEQIHFIRALVLNDELYQYCMEQLSNTCDTVVKDVTNRMIQ